MKMLPYHSEKLLAYFYSWTGALSLVTTITTAVVWRHWKYVLNTCVQPSVYDQSGISPCGCILFGFSTPTYFIGGHEGFCYWATFGLLIPLFFCVILGLFHVFRVCFNNKGKPRKGTTTVRQRSGDIIVMTTEAELAEDDISPYYWTPVAVIAGFFTVYTLVHAIMLTDGFFKTCKQYRYELVKHIQAGGPMVGVLQGRLSCGAVLDFMDYLHPNVSFERRRDDRINTSLALIIAIVCSWLCVAGWIGILIVNIMRSRASRSVRV